MFICIFAVYELSDHKPECNSRYDRSAAATAAAAAATTTTTTATAAAATTTTTTAATDKRTGENGGITLGSFHHMIMCCGVELK